MCTHTYMYMHTCKKELYTEEEFLKVLHVWISDYRTCRLHGAGRKGQLVSRGENNRPFRRRTKLWCPNRPQWRRREQALLAEAHYRLEVERNPSKGLAQPFPQWNRWPHLYPVLTTGSVSWHFLNVAICAEPVTSSAGGKNYSILALSQPQHESSGHTEWWLGAANRDSLRPAALREE